VNRPLPRFVPLSGPPLPALTTQPGFRATVHGRQHLPVVGDV